MVCARLVAIVLLVLASSSVSLALEESDRLWTVGERAFDDKLYALSARNLDRLVLRFPKDKRAPEATLLLAKARLAQGQLEPALAAFKQAQTFSPMPGGPGEAIFWEAETLLRLERFAQARPVLGRFLAEALTSPMVPDALFSLGWADLRTDHREDAVTSFRRLVTSHRSHRSVPAATFYLGRTLVELKRPAEAVGPLRGFTTSYPDHAFAAEARYLLGEALVSSGETRDGVAELRAFIATYPAHELAPHARRVVVDTLLSKGDPDDLAEEYKTLLTMSPTGPEWLYDAGLIATRLGRPPAVETAWARLAKEFPSHPLALRVSLDLAQSAFERKAYKEAVGYAQAATRSGEEPVRLSALVLLGESELRLKRYPQALDAFKAAADAPGQEPGLRYRALAGSGLAHEEQRQWAQASRYYQEVAADSPDETLSSWAKARHDVVEEKLKPPPPPKKPAKAAAPQKSAPAKKPAAKPTPKKVGPAKGAARR